MHQDVRFELAEAIASQGFVGDLTVAVPRRLARRIVDGYPILDSTVRSEQDIERVEPVSSGGLTIRFTISHGPDFQMQLIQDGMVRAFVDIPPRLRLTM